MRATKELNTNKGITLIALVITIIVMLILVAVTISMAVNGGLFEKAGEAVGKTNNAMKAEGQLGGGRIKVNGIWYESIDAYLNNNPIEQKITIEGTLTLEIEKNYNVQTSTPVTGQLTAVLTEIKGTVSWTSSNEEVAKVNNTGLVTAVAEGTAKITASVTQEGVTRTDECLVSVEVEREVISKADPFVGYYADLDGNPETVEGIIYADMYDVKTGSWEGWQYTIPKEENPKNYYISKTNHDGPFGVADVLTATGDGEDRFYVMALTDVGTSNKYFWYKNAQGKMDPIVTSDAFGQGLKNTETIMGYWKAGTPYGTGTQGDMWGEIQEEVNAGWFVPSKGEWLAFLAELTSSIEGWYTVSIGWTGMSHDRYWSSSQNSDRTVLITEFVRQRGRRHQLSR